MKRNWQTLIAAGLVVLASVWSSAQGTQPAAGQAPTPAGTPQGQTPPQNQGAALPQAGRGTQPPAPMSFFVTSTGLGKGANLGGLAGADAHCQALAAAAGAGDRTWRAYLSTQGPNAVSARDRIGSGPWFNAKGTRIAQGLAGADAHCQALAAAAGAGDRTWRAYLSTQGPNAVNARDRIGSGPWFNAKGTRIAQGLADLHGDTLELARLGNNFNRATALTEKGDQANGVGATPNQHDMLTGSQPDGRAYTDAADHTCNNWTSDSTGTAQVGHHDRTGGSNISWNATHASRGCSQDNLVSTGGAGLFYCFAATSAPAPAR